MQLDRVLKLDDLYKIQTAIVEAGYPNDRFEVTMEVRSDEVLKKVNEEYYYNGNKEGVPPEVDEVDVCIGNVHFKYVVAKDVE